MTLNWGHKVTLGFSAFVVFMFFMVYKSMHTDFQLVSKEYYKDELAYQQVIDGTNRANQLSTAVSIAQNNETVTIQLPEELKGKKISGNIWLYCPTDDKKDQRLTLTADADARLQIERKTIAAGNYVVKINWTADGTAFYNEQALTVK
ncbi:MAG: FixH family protein [Lacibacter sp.]